MGLAPTTSSLATKCNSCYATSAFVVGPERVARSLAANQAAGLLLTYGPQDGQGGWCCPSYLRVPSAAVCC